MSEPIYIPAPSNQYTYLGESIHISSRYIIFGDSHSGAGVLFAVKYENVGNGTFTYAGQLNPYKKWGTYQNFGEHVTTKDNADGSTTVYVTASSAWIHSNSRRAVKGITEAIGVVYVFLIKDGVCKPENYYVVSTKVENGMMNSTTNLMLNIGNDIFITLADKPNIYRIECDEKVTINL